MSSLTRFRQSTGVWLWALKNVPLLAWVQPRVEELNAQRTVISIPLRRRQKNHLNSMYFGVLACGADIAGGLIAIHLIRQKSAPVSFVFKDFKANFLKRPEARTFFTCKDGEKIQKLVNEAIESGERVHETVKVVATCPEKLGDQPVAEFELTLSLKKKK